MKYVDAMWHIVSIDMEAKESVSNPSMDGRFFSMEAKESVSNPFAKPLRHMGWHVWLVHREVSRFHET